MRQATHWRFEERIVRKDFKQVQIKEYLNRHYSKYLYTGATIFCKLLNHLLGKGRLAVNKKRHLNKNLSEH